MDPKFPLHFDLEVRRLLNTLDTRATPRSLSEERAFANRFLRDPATPSAFGHLQYHDFSALRQDPIANVQRAAKAAPYSPEMFERELVRLLAKEADREANKRASEIMRGNHG